MRSGEEPDMTHRHLTRRSHRVALGVVLVALTVTMLTACGDDDTDQASTGDTSTSAAPSSETTAGSTPASGATSSPGTDTAPSSGAPPTTAATGDGIDTMPDADTDPKSAPSEVTADDATPHLVAVRTARHEGYDRVTFEFDGPAPGYQVQYIDGPILSDGEGAPVAVDGAAHLQVRMEPASGYDLEAGAPTYTGPTVVSGTDTSEVVEVVRTGDFEAVLTWVIGFNDRVDFRVDTLPDPTRIVVDVRNH